MSAHSDVIANILENMKLGNMHGLSTSAVLLGADVDLVSQRQAEIVAKTAPKFTTSMGVTMAADDATFPTIPTKPSGRSK